MYLSSMSACNKSRQSLSCPVDTTSKISYKVVIPFVFPANFHWKPNNKKKALKTIKMNTIAFKVTINMKKQKEKKSEYFCLSKIWNALIYFHRRLMFKVLKYKWDWLCTWNRSKSEITYFFSSQLSCPWHFCLWRFNWIGNRFKL